MTTLLEQLNKKIVPVEHRHSSKLGKWNWGMGRYIGLLVIEIYDDFPQPNEDETTETLARLNNMPLSPINPHPVSSET